MAMSPEVEHFQQFARPSLRFMRIGTPEAGDKFEIFERVELVIEDRLVGQPGRDAFGGNRIASRIHAEDADAARIGRKQASRHAQRGRLAGTIGPQQGIELPGANCQIEASHGRRRTETLAQGPQFKCGSRSGGRAFHGIWHDERMRRVPRRALPGR